MWTRSPHLRPDRVEQEVAGRRDPAADDDPVRRDDGDHVADPDAEIAADLGQPGECPGVAGPGRFDRLLGGRGPARRGDPVGTGERLETAVVAAAARRPVRIDRLVADLAGRAVVPEQDPAVDRDHAADARPEGQPDHRRRAAPRPEPQLGQPERAGVVDQRGRACRGWPPPGPRPDGPSQSPGMLTRNRVAPATGSYSPGTPTPSEPDPRPALHRAPARVGDPADDRVRAVAGAGRDLAAIEDPPLAARRRDDRPFEVRHPEVDPEVMRLVGLGGVHDSPVTRVYAAATATMMIPKSICRPASGQRRARSGARSGPSGSARRRSSRRSRRGRP